MEVQEFTYNDNFDDNFATIAEMMANPKEFIRQDISSIIKYLWSMNILARPDKISRTDSELTISLGTLSDKNTKVLSEIQEEIRNLTAEEADTRQNKINFSRNTSYLACSNVIRIPPWSKLSPNNKNSKEITNLLFKLTMQDIPREGYMTLDEFLSKYKPGLTKTINQDENPDFDGDYTLEGFQRYLDAQRQYTSIHRPATNNRIAVFIGNENLANPSRYDLETKSGCQKYIQDMKDRIKYTEDAPEWVRNMEPKEENYDNFEDYINDIKKHVANNSQFIRLKTADEYLKDFKPFLDADYTFEDCYDEEEGKVFYSKELYEGHMRYKGLMENLAENSTLHKRR